MGRAAHRASRGPRGGCDSALPLGKVRARLGDDWPRARKMKNWIFLSGFCSILGACSTSDLAPLDGPELQRLIPGNSFNYTGNLPDGRGFSGQMTFNENGNLFVSTSTGIPEGGTWRISGDQVCTRLVALRSGQEECFFISKGDNGAFVTSHGFSVKRVRP